MLYKGLGLRLANQDLFAGGEYVGLETVGKGGHHIVASARRLDDQFVVTITPRFYAGLVSEGLMPLGPTVWGDTGVVLPEGFPNGWRDTITDKVIDAGSPLLVACILEDFPVALLVNEEGES